MAEIEYELAARTPAASRWGALARVAELGAPAYAVVALVALAFGFVGFTSSNFNVDELFTLFLVDHHGGLAEVLRRALTDTHPPAYYLFLYEWTRLFGLSETATRLPSAIFATAAVGVFAFGLRRTYSPAAIAFACAVAAASPFWLYHSQNVRNYALCMLCSAVLLAAAVSLARDPPAAGRFPFGRWAAIALAGAIGSFSHFYMLLTTGIVLGLLILRLRDRRLQLALAVTGLAILLPSLVYIRALMHHTQQDIHHMWFQRDVATLAGVLATALDLATGVAAKYLLGAFLILALVAAARRRRRAAAVDDAAEACRWVALFAAAVLALVYATGVVICFLVAPSLSDQNLLVAAPMAWALAAALYDAAVPKLPSPWRALLVVVCIAATASQLAILRGRFLPRIEQWKASADYIQSLPQCRGQTIPIVVPPVFGPDTPFFHQLAKRYFFGRYFPDQARLADFSAPAFTKDGVSPELDRLFYQRAHDPKACPVLAWAVHDFEEGDAEDLKGALEDLPEIDGQSVRLHEFFQYSRDGLKWEPYPSGFVVELGPPDPKLGPVD